MWRCGPAKQRVRLGPSRYFRRGGRRRDTDANAHCHSDRDRHGDTQPHCHSIAIANGHAATDAHTQSGAIGKAAPNACAPAVENSSRQNFC
jgi:hypothetical protein